MIVFNYDIFNFLSLYSLLFFETSLLIALSLYIAYDDTQNFRIKNKSNIIFFILSVFYFIIFFLFKKESYHFLYLEIFYLFLFFVVGVLLNLKKIIGAGDIKYLISMPLLFENNLSIFLFSVVILSGILASLQLLLSDRYFNYQKDLGKINFIKNSKHIPMGLTISICVICFLIRRIIM